ncbi:hypothetical protein QFZ77_001351 [Paenibacillus sp. V4I3]|nr:hypothetical protein [Paenibacillus sp. V4I3]
MNSEIGGVIVKTLVLVAHPNMGKSRVNKAQMQCPMSL